MRRFLVAAVMAASIAPPALAEVTDRSPEGFELVETATIAAAPAKVWAALVEPARWWDSGHTYSGDAKNLSIDLVTGCFCERLPNGYVRHMTVVYADGGSTLRMSGGLGPLQQSGAVGALEITLKPQGAGTQVKLTYDVGGYAKGGLEATWAAPVDIVLGQQLTRLKAVVEKGWSE